jgi:hypothetical protein
MKRHIAAMGLLIAIGACAITIAQDARTGSDQGNRKSEAAESEADITEAIYFQADNVKFVGPAEATIMAASVGRLRLVTNIPISSQKPVWSHGYYIGDAVGESGQINAAGVLVVNDPSGFYAFETNITFATSEKAGAVVRWRFGGAYRVWTGPILVPPI